MSEEERSQRSKFVKQLISQEGDLYSINRRLRGLVSQYIEGLIPIDDIYKEIRKDAQ
jgi:hypothetical protein